MSRMLCIAPLLSMMFAPAVGGAQARMATPIRQATLAPAAATPVPVSLRDASRNDRWLGLGARDVRWAPDGASLYFRWNQRPVSNDLAEADPWFRTDRDGAWVEQLSARDAELVPAEVVAWNAAATRAAWISANAIYLYAAGKPPATRRIVALEGSPSRLRFAEHDAALHFMMGEALYRYDIDAGALSVVAARVTVDAASRTPAATRLAEQQRDLFERTRERERLQVLRGQVSRSGSQRPQQIPVATGSRIDEIRQTPDGRFLTVRVRTSATNRPATKYLDYLDASGYSKVLDAREKAGEPRDRIRLGVLAFDPTVAADSVKVRWLTLADAGNEQTVPHGPYWSPDGTRAVVQFVGEHDKDLWLTEMDVASGRIIVLTHDHDDGWIGGPPIQSNNTGPALLEWLPDGQLVYGTERSGWSHLARVGATGTVEPLTSGDWEVRAAGLSRDHKQWLLQTSRDGAAEDHLYLMPAGGGALARLTTRGGRNSGVLSPDGTRLAILRSDNTAFPDLYVRTVLPQSTGAERRITESGTDEYLRRWLVKPEIVPIPHPDGKPVWAALYRPARPNAERAALIHVHGGGYRQFAHLGWSVYGWSGHVGLLHYFLEQGYTVLDFDYRGGAGFGKVYRTDIAGAMGTKDVDGAVAAARWLVRNAGIDSTRIGMYGVSYGGFMTLMSLFRYPGVFAAGIARAPVTDWAHYSDGWTSRILGVPQTDTAAYRRSSPIFFAEGLRDHLLIEHGLVDDNVHFQDTARLVQRLLELEKEFDVMYYPTEPHVVETETSRYDQARRAARFFDHHLRGRP